MQVSSIKGKMILSISEGRRLGTVEELLVDPRALQVVAVLVEGGEQARADGADAGRAVIRFADIRSIGPDALTVERAALSHPAADQEPLAGTLLLGSAIGLKVVDATGTLLGKIEEIEIEPRDGRVTGLVVKQGGVLGMGGGSDTLPAAAIRSLGPQVVMVDARTASGAASEQEVTTPP